MTDKEVLQKAIEIAIDNGLKTKDVNYYTFNRMVGDVMFDDVRKDSWAMLDTYDCYNLLFSHDFAKAFWKSGDKIRVSHNYNIYEGGRLTYNSKEIPVWQYHLQQMVLCDNPIDYLRKFVEVGYIKGETKIVGQRNLKEDGTFEDKFISNAEKID